jgi:predicted MFS family arabinose efflux permease
MTARAPLFFGWKVVWTAFAVAVFGWAFGFYIPSALLHLLHERHGWSVATISAAISWHYLLSAGIIVYSAEIHARFGLWRVTAIGAGLLAIGAFGWVSATQHWQLFLAAIISGAGWAATSGAAVNAMIMPWFRTKRATAISLAFNGASVGGVVPVPLFIWLQGEIGLIPATLALAGLGAAVIVLLSALYLRPTLASLGLHPDGAATDDAPPQVACAAIPRAQLLREMRFVTLALGFALALFAQVGLISHIVALLAPSLGTVTAGWMVSAMTIMAIIGRTALGFTIGGADRRLITAVNLLVQVVGVVLLAITTHPALLLAGCILFGLGVGNLVSLMPLAAHAEFQPVDVARVVALIIAINQATFSFAPGTLGAVHDATGGYAWPLVLVIALQLLACVALLAGGFRRR